MKTVAITGGAGFLGSHLCVNLLNDGLKVICIDNLITGNLKNIEHVKDHKNFYFINHDVTKFISINENVDFILHFASPASPSDYLVYPIQTLKVGSLGTHNALGLAKEKKATFLLASTSEVYGDPQVHPQNENYWGHVNPIGPRGVYDEAKRFAEAITMAYHRHHKIETRIARIFNTYGPNMRAKDGRAIPNFISQALNNKPMTIYGDGTQTRSFCYIDDQVDGLYKLLNSEYNDPVNIGNAEEISILQLANEILKLTKSESKIVFKELPVNDPKVRQPDITKAKDKLSWEPKFSLEDGLKKTIEYFKKFL
ncbi:MAG: SDR family oxidoreductase [Ignavibacteria bacterium]|nr:SDR family oxidoreductase [Ignavibacteria bacterium]MBT8392197.1 SDR family oxidoreductase [Ignavibacteria bacterium]NNL20077.1 SDR family oxidoreductase [Ignavibacteriaceae bacterium]